MDHGKRVNSGKIFQQTMRELKLDRSDLNPCVHRDSERDSTGEEHGNDFLMVGEVTMLEHAREQFTWRFVVKSGNISHSCLGKRDSDIFSNEQGQ